MHFSGLLEYMDIYSRTSNKFAVLYTNAEVNLRLLQAGEHADKIIHNKMHKCLWITMGGTGATLVVPFYVYVAC